MPRQYKEIDIPRIQAAEFIPAPPPQLPDSLEQALSRFPPSTASLLQQAGRSLGYFTTTPSQKIPGEAVLTVAVSHLLPNEQVVLVLDTLTHMNKQDLSPFLLRPEIFEGYALHYGCFRIDAAMRSTIGFIRTTGEELTQLTSREDWKNFFDRTEPLLPGRQEEKASTAVPDIEEAGQRLPTVLEPLHTASSNYPLAPQTTAGRLYLAKLPGQHEAEVIQCWLFAPENPQRLLIVCDGQTYSSRYPLWPEVQAINADYPQARTALLLLEPAGQLTRDRFLGNHLYLPTWLSKTCLPWVATHIGLPPASRCTIAGASLGGLAAAQTVKAIPHLIGNAVIQSASFWWQGSDRRQAEGYVLEQWLAEPLPTDIRLFCQVGEYEGFLLSWNRAFRDILIQKKVEHVYREYCGGHDYACWRQGILDALTLQLTGS